MSFPRVLILISPGQTSFCKSYEPYRQNNRYLVSKFIMGIITIPGTLLAVAGYSMPDYFVCNSPVCNYFYSDIVMFYYGIMPRLNNTCYKLYCRIVSCLVLRFIACSAGGLYFSHDGNAVNLLFKVPRLFDYFHNCRSSIIFVFCPTCPLSACILQYRSA